MPEGDVLFRTAATLDRWLGSRRITGAESHVRSAPVDRLLGKTVERVEANGKHLLIRLDSGDVIHSHLRMSGSWHVYTAPQPWRRPRRQARLVLNCGDHQAVCFNAPIVEVLSPAAVASHPSLSGLGPDVLDRPIDTTEVLRRAATRPPATALGELLLDQRVVAGIGNIWRCEALAVERLHPWTPRSAVDDEALSRLVATAGRLMHESMAGRGRPGARLVYRRSGRPCGRCRTLVVSRPQGEQARTAYWCPACQLLPPVFGAPEPAVDN